MREIKFRGKDTENNNCWIYGGVVHQTDYYGRATDKWFIIDGTDTQDYDIGENIRVVPETIGQYTGLTDKNGVEIYEGDIVKAKYHELRYFGDEIDDCYIEFVEEVTWLTSHNGFGLKIMIEDIPLYRPLDFVTKVNGIKLVELEVIGNIHDNPELLEVEE